MCLGIPGQVTEIQQNPTGLTMGKVDFEGVVKLVNLATLPDIRVGDYVMVHYGVATSKLDEHEAQSLLQFLKELENLGEEDLS